MSRTFLTSFLDRDNEHPLIMNIQCRYILSVSLLSVIFLLHGCMKEDWSDCGLYLQFKYTNHPEQTDKFAEEIQAVRLFVFDAEKRFVGEWQHNSSSGNQIRIPLEKGTYTLVAWGNLSEDFKISDFNVGSTTFDEVFLSLSRDAEQTVNVRPKSLFHGMVSNIYVKQVGLQKQEIDFVHDVNHVQVKVDGLPVEAANMSTTGRGITPAPNTRFALFITSDNADLKFDNSRKMNSPYVTYTPLYSQTETQLNTDFSLMRLWAGDNSRLKLLHQEDNGTWSTRYEESLTDLLLKNPATDLARMSNFSISLEFDYTYTLISITVNGWKEVINDDGQGGIIG